MPVYLGDNTSFYLDEALDPSLYSVRLPEADVGRLADAVAEAAGRLRELQERALAACRVRGAAERAPARAVGIPALAAADLSPLVVFFATPRYWRLLFPQALVMLWGLDASAVEHYVWRTSWCVSDLRAACRLRADPSHVSRHASAVSTVASRPTAGGMRRRSEHRTPVAGSNHFWCAAGWTSHRPRLLLFLQAAALLGITNTPFPTRKVPPPPAAFHSSVSSCARCCNKRRTYFDPAWEPPPRGSARKEEEAHHTGHGSSGAGDR